MDDYIDDYDSVASRKRKVWVKEVRAVSMTEAFVRLDEWANTGNELYDMYYVDYDTYFDGYKKLIVIGLEVDSTRFMYDV